MESLHGPLPLCVPFRSLVSEEGTWGVDFCLVIRDSLLVDRKVFVYRFPLLSELAEGPVEGFECFQGYPFSAIFIFLFELLKG